MIPAGRDNARSADEIPPGDGEKREYAPSPVSDCSAASAERVFTLAALTREGESGLPNADSQRHADFAAVGIRFSLFATRKNLAAGFFIRWTIRTDFSSTMTRVLAE